MSANGKLTGKKALVTGSGTGIGREIALEFARQGADVVLHYAHAVAGAESAVAEIQAMGRKAAVFKADFDDVERGSAIGRQGDRFPRPGRLPGEQRRHHVQPPVRPRHRRAVRPALPRQRAGAVLPDAADRRGHGEARRRRGVQHHVDPRRVGRAGAFGLRRLEGRDHRLHAHAVGRIGPQGNPRERHRPRLRSGGELREGHGRPTIRWPRPNGRRTRFPSAAWATPVDIGKLAAFLCSRRRAVHHRPDDRGRRRHDVADVVDLRFPQRVDRPFRHRLSARRVTRRGSFR